MRDARYILRSVIRSRISPGVLANTCLRAAHNKVGEVLVGSRFDSPEGVTDGVEDRWRPRRTEGRARAPGRRR